MTKWVTMIDSKGTVLLSEQYKDGKEKFDDGSMMVFGETKAEIRARGLNLQKEEGSRVIISDKEYVPEEEDPEQEEET